MKDLIRIRFSESRFINRSQFHSGGDCYIPKTLDTPHAKACFDCGESTDALTDYHHTTT